MNEQTLKRLNVQRAYSAATRALKARLDNLCHEGQLAQWDYFRMVTGIPDDVCNWRSVLIDRMIDYERLAPKELRKIESIAKRAVSEN